MVPRNLLFILITAVTAVSYAGYRIFNTRSKRYYTVDPIQIPSGTKTVYDFTMTSIDGEAVPLSRYRGKVLLIVNVASYCGYTPQYEGLQKLYEKYRSRGFEILAFPSNNFGKQEPGSDEEIKSFCSSKYGVSFPLFSKIIVKGDSIHPLYRYLTHKEENGVLDAGVRWNFQKFLIDKQGRERSVFYSGVKPLSEALTSAVEKLFEE